MISNKILNFWLILIGILISGCASYRTNSEIEFASIYVPVIQSKVVISESSLSEKKYTKLGPVVAEVKKLSLFHKDPTKDQVNYVLLVKAEELKADAVVDVKYDSGIGVWTWGYMSGEGTAVKFIDQ